MSIQRFLPRPTAAPLLPFAFFKQKSLHHSAYTKSTFQTSSTSLSSSFSTCPPLLLSFSPIRLYSTNTTLDLPEIVDSETDSDGEISSEDDEFGSAIVREGLEEVLERNVEANPNRESMSKPNLSVKEKKELASYAHSLGKKLKSQQVGKSGVTDHVIAALIETLEANELLKLKIHNSCPGEMEDVVKHLEEGTGSVLVGKIGRTIILYRPSLTKLKAREKKQAQRPYIRKPPTVTQSQSKSGEPGKSIRGRRGSSRFGA